MSTLKVNTITNNGSAVNFTTDIKLGNGNVTREYYSQADAPSTTTNGAVWWDTTNSVYKMLIAGEWYTVEFTTPPPAFAGDTAVFGGGTSGPYSNIIDYASIPIPSNATDFGDLTLARQELSSASNGSRGIFAAGRDDANPANNTIDYVTIATPANAIDFGDLTLSQRSSAACSDGSRGLFYLSGYTSNNRIDYITIATTGNAAVFGSLSADKIWLSSCASEVYGLFAGGYDNATANTLSAIEKVTIATLGNSTSFGDLDSGRYHLAGCSDGTYGFFTGGNSSYSQIQYVTIDTPANATIFGSLNGAIQEHAACANGNTAVVGGGGNRMDTFSTKTLGSATDFGDLTVARWRLAACSGN